MRTRNDFLARITALLEADAAEQIEVEHLRHEAFVRLCVYGWYAAANVGQLPLTNERSVHGCIVSRCNQ